MASQQQINQYRNQGYFIADDAVELDMLEELTMAAHEVMAKVRSGEVIDDAAGVRTDGPGAAGADPHFVCGIMAPEFGAPVFAEYLGSAPHRPLFAAIYRRGIALGMGTSLRCWGRL